MRTFLVSLLIGAVATASPVWGFSESELVPGGTLLTLEESLARVLKDDAQVKRAEARLEKEEALLKAVKREAFPKLKTELYTAAVSHDNRGIIFWTSEIRLPLFEGGRRIHEKRKKDLEVQEQKLHIEETRQEVAYQVKAIYIGLLKEKELTRLSQEWVKESQKFYITMKSLYEKELMTREDLFRWEALYKAAQQELLKHKEAMDYGESLIMELAAVGEREHIELEPLGEVSAKELDFNTSLEEMRKQNPLYEITKLRVKQKEEEKKVLRSERFPKLGLSTRFNLAKDSFVDQNRFELGIVGSWNIWDFGVLGNEIKAKEAEIKEVTEDGHIQTRTLEHEARKLMGDLRVAWGKIEATKGLLQDKKEAYQNDKTRLLAGEKGEAEIFDAFVTLTQVQMTVIEAITDYRLLSIQLEKIIGEEVSA